MATLEVFADITCPFTHVGLQRLVEERTARGGGPDLRVRAWPLELVNDAPLQGSVLAPKVAALRGSVAPDLFAGFDPDRFPTTSLPALDLAAAAYAVSPAIGEQVSLLLRHALFEGGQDISDPAVLAGIADQVGGVPISGDERATVLDEWADGRARGVIGSPHFFLDGGDVFCPALDISHTDAGELDIRIDRDGFEDFLARAFA